MGKRKEILAKDVDSRASLDAYVHSTLLGLCGAVCNGANMEQISKQVAMTRRRLLLAVDSYAHVERTRLATEILSKVSEVLK